MSAEIRQAVEVLSERGGVVELRALKNGTTAAGYFDNPDTLSREAAKLDGQGFAVYVTANPANPALLSRAANRIKRAPRETTSDRDVLRRRWLLVDLDPVRPAGVSSTDDEKEQALRRAREVYACLNKRKWPEPVVADSGNGAHLLYAVDLPNDADSLDLIRGVLEALSFQFSDGAVSVDTTTCNAGRIWKLYGTTARKGDSTDERPHRVSRLLKVPDERVEVSREQLEALAASKPGPVSNGPRSRPASEFDLEAWISDHSISVRREGTWQQAGYRWVLEECPWNGHSDNSAYIVRFPSGAIAAGCHHDSCQSYGWRELREHHEPDAYKRPYQRNGPEDAADGGYGVLLSEVVPEHVRWLWKGRVALGKLNLVEGDPGTGKSAATTDLAARVSVGKPWPDGAGCEAGGVVILSAEDGLADTIRPRFDAAGGDPSRAVAVSTVPDAEGNERQIAIPDDLRVIEAAIERVGAVLVIVDPLMAFLPGEVNSHRDQDVRRALAPLARLAERTGAAVVVVRHLNKRTGGNALYRGGRTKISEPSPMGEGRDYRWKVVSNLRSREEWVAVPVPDSGIPREMVESARHIVANNKPCSSNGDRFWELPGGGVLRCSECGRRMRTSVTRKKDGKRYFYYSCAGRREGKLSSCSNRKTHRAERIEPAVWNLVSALLTDPERLRVGLDAMVEQERSGGRGDPDHEARVWLEKLAEADRMRAGYQELAAKGLMTIEELSARLEELEATRRTASDELEAIRRRAERLAGLEQDRDALMEFYAGAVPEDLERLGPEERRRIYGRLRLELWARSDGTLEARGLLLEGLRVGPRTGAPFAKRHLHHGLRAREDGEHGVRGHLLFPAKLALSRRAFVEITLAIGRHRDHAGHAVLLLDSIAQHAVSSFLDTFFHGLLFPAASAALLAPEPPIRIEGHMLAGHPRCC